MHRSTPHHFPTRARVAFGAAASAIAAAGAFAVAGSVAGASAPPQPPGDLDSQREQIVAGVVESAEAQGLPLDRDCVSGIVDRLPDADVPLILEDIQAELEAMDDTVPDFGSMDLPDFSIPDFTMPDFTLPDLEMPEFTLPDLGSFTIPEFPDFTLPDLGSFTIPDFTFPDIELPELTMPDIDVDEISEEADALGEELIGCLRGEADPALVEQAVAAISQSPDGADLEPECAANVLSTFPEPLLQAIVDSGGDYDIDTDSLPPGVTEDDFANVFLMFACVDFGEM